MEQGKAISMECTVRDRLRADYDEVILRSSQVNETLAAVAGKMALNSYKTLLLEQARYEAKASKALADLNRHRQEHGC